MQIMADQLKDATTAILEAAGTPKDIAEYLAGSLVVNNLVGHDSHGVIRIPKYLSNVDAGKVIPNARASILRESPATAVVSGNWGFGQVAVKYATELAIKKAQESNIAAVSVVKMHHMGRLGEYASMIADAGMIGMIVTGGFSGTTRQVAPFGGAGRALGTNPWSFAVPAGAHDDFLVDFATSVVAEGKLQVARAKKIAVGENIIVDSDGQPTTNPNDFYDGGMLLPFGGYKGYAMSLLADLLGALLPGTETFGEPPHTQGTFVLAVRIGAFRSLGDFVNAVDNRFDEIKAIPPAPGCDGVLIPGQPELRANAERLKNGIDLPDDTWNQLVETGKRYNVSIQDPQFKATA